MTSCNTVIAPLYNIQKLCVKSHQGETHSLVLDRRDLETADIIVPITQKVISQRRAKLIEH